MTKPRDARRTAYDRARHAFDDLQIEDKAIFIVEATAATLARGIEQASRAAADEVSDLFRRGAAKKHDSSRRRTDDRPGAAEPPTGQQRAPRPNGDGA